MMMLQDGYNPNQMKKVAIFITVLLIVSACSSGLESDGTVARLTPYQTQPVTIEPTQVDKAQSTAAPTPAATATPIVHIVSLGETISSIALQYGVTIDAILNANPGISPNVMIVGDEVIVPTGDAINTNIIDESVSSAIRLGEPYCIQSGDGLWCSVMVENGGEDAIMDAVVSFVFIDGSGNSILEKNVPTVLRRLSPNNALPAAIFLADPPAGYQDIDVSLYSARGLLQATQAVEVIEEDRKVVLEKLRADITGTMRVEEGGESDRANISIAAAAMNANRDVIGVRRQDITVEKEENFAFSITVYSSGDEISEVILYAEVN